MIPVSVEAAAAIESPDRVLHRRLRVSWDGTGDYTGPYDDISDHAGAIQVERGLEGDLPAAVQVPEGVTGAELDVSLVAGGDPTRSAAWWYSRYNSESPLSMSKRLACPTQCHVGVETSTGIEWIPRFAGHTSHLSTQGTTAALRGLDPWDRLQAPVELPMMLRPSPDLDIQPAVDLQWVLAYSLYANGIHTVPPPLAGCVAAMSLLGSAWPTVGTLFRSRKDIGGGSYIAPFFSSGGPFGKALSADANVSIIALFDPTHRIAPDPGGGFRMEGWHFVGSSTISAAIGLVSGTDGSGVSATIGSATLTLSVTRVPGAGTFFTGPTLAGAASWRYIGIHVAFGAATTTVTWRVDGVTTSETKAVTPGMWGADWTNVGIVPYARIAAFQVAAEAVAPTAWNDDFVPGAVLDDPYSGIYAIVPSEQTNSADLITEISSAELATAFFDESGVFRWWTRDHWADVDTDLITLTTETSVADIAITEDLTQVRNRVMVEAVPPTIGTAQMVWTSSEAYELAPLSSITVWADLGDTALFNPDTSAYTGGQSLSGSYVTGNLLADGSGTVVPGTWMTVTMTAFVSSVRIDILNRTASTWYVNGVGGVPGIGVWGTPVVFDSASTQRVELADTTSQDLYGGERSLTVSANRWRQSYGAAQHHAEQLLGELAYAKPQPFAVTVRGDPRLQIGDRARLIDTDGLALDTSVFVTAITDDLGADGSYMQHLRCVPIPDPLVWDSGHWDLNAWE